MRRRLAILGLLAPALIAVPVVGTSAPGLAPFSPPQYRGPVPLPESGVLFGAFVAVDGHTGKTRKESFDNFEKISGRKMNMERVFYFFDDAFPTLDDYAARDAGRTLILSLSAFNRDGSANSWADIAAGLYDDVLDERAAAITAFGAPMFFTFHHEPSNAGPGGGSAGTPEEFIAAYRHVHDRFVAKGVENVTYTEILMAWTFYLHRADTLYAGDDYVDVLAADGYSGCARGPWRSVSQVFLDFYYYGRLHNKPMLIAEWGAGEDQSHPGRKGEWLTDSLAQFERWPGIKGVSYFHSAPVPECARWVDTSPSSVAAFRAIGADPYTNPVPLVTIASGPADPSSSRTATFEFSASDPNSTFRCSLDGAAYDECSSPTTITDLAPGEKSFAVRATDREGNAGNPTTWSWTVSKLIVTVTAGPLNQTSSTVATLAFSATKPVAFICSLDGATGKECVSPITYTGLSLGDHSFTAMGSGHDQEQSASWNWKVVRREATITAADFSFNPAVVTIAQGGAPEWSFDGPSSHTSTERSGMGLWDSGALGPGSVFDFELVGAATYSYVCAIHPAMSGTIKVLPVAVPANGNLKTQFDITYASQESQPGYAYDVQIFRPGTSQWVDWWYGQVGPSLEFTADSGAGTYSFRARLTNSVTGFSSTYSDAVSIVVG